MKNAYLVSKIAIAIWMMFAMFFAYAGSPVWTFTALTPTTVMVPANGTATVKYFVTNQSKKVHTLRMLVMQGVTQDTSAGNCPLQFVLGYRQSCILALTIDGTTLPGNLVGGPVVCNQANFSECYRPNPQDTLTITKTGVGNTVSPGALVFTLTPPAITTVQINHVLTLNYTIHNKSSFVVPGLTYTIDSADEFIIRNNAITNNCASSLEPGASCNLQYKFNAPATPAQYPITLTANSSRGLQTNSSTTIDVTGDTGGLEFTNAPPPAASVEVTQPLILSYTLQNTTGFTTATDLMYQLEDSSGNTTRNNAIANNCGSTLAPSETCNLEYIFQAPNSPSPPTYPIKLTADSAQGLGASSLTTVTVTPSSGSISFIVQPPQPPATIPVKVNTSTLLDYTLMNNSSLPVTVLTYTMDVPQGVAVRNNAIPNNCGATLAAGATCNLQYQYTAPATQPSPPTFSITLTADSLQGLQAVSSSTIDVTPAVFCWETHGPTSGAINSIFAVNALTAYAGTSLNGILKTVSGGSSWSVINNGITHNNILSVAAVANTVYAASNGSGIFKSFNSGINWTAVNTGLTNNVVNSVSAFDADTVYAGTQGGGVFKTTNGGASWAAVNTGLTNTNVASVYAVSATVAYAGTEGGGVFLTTNGGISWAAVNNGLTNLNIRSVAAVNAAVVYVGTNGGGVFVTTNGGATWDATGLNSGNISSIDAVSASTAFAGSATDGMFRTTNGGATWVPINNGLTNSTILSVYAFDANTVYVGTTNGGAFRTTDGGASWSAINLNLMNIGTVSLGVVDANTVYAGSSASGLFKTTNGGLSWASANSNITDVRSLVAIDANTVYAGSNTFGVFKTINGGISWAAVNNGITDLSIRSLFAIDSNTVFAGGLAGFFVTTDGGVNWVPRNTGLTNTNVIAIYALNANLIYVGTQSGGAFKTTNGGLNWTPINTGLTTTTVQSLAAVDANTVYAGTGPNTGVFKTVNGGGNWTSISNGLGAITVQSLSALDASTQTIYAGANGGVFITTNGGQSWSLMNNCLPSTDVSVVVALDPDTIYAGTSASTLFSGGAFRWTEQ